jgi:hypothetical protein
MANARASRAAVGFTIKSGWAVAVLVGGSRTKPRALDGRRIDLSDPAIPDARQPYHAGFGTARQPGPALSRLVASVERFGRESVTGLLQHYEGEGHQLRSAGLVVGSLIEPDQIANDHIRIHALEGKLFRNIVEAAVVQHDVPCSIWRERDLYASAAAALQQSEGRLRNTLTALGRDLTGPWRAEHKAAALAAWLALTGAATVQAANAPTLKKSRT